MHETTKVENDLSKTLLTQEQLSSIQGKKYLWLMTH